MVLYRDTLLRDILRPIYGLVCLQPLVILWFFWKTPDIWWENYLNIGWPLNLLGTIWLIPCYAFYEKVILPHPELPADKNEGLL